MANNVETILGCKHEYNLYSNKFLLIKRIDGNSENKIFIHDFIDTDDAYLDIYLKRNGFRIDDKFTFDSSVKYLSTKKDLTHFIFAPTPNDCDTLLEDAWEYDSFIKLSKYKKLLMENVSRFYDENNFEINKHSNRLIFIKDISNCPILVNTNVAELDDLDVMFKKREPYHKIKLNAYDGSVFTTTIGNLTDGYKKLVFYNLNSKEEFDNYKRLLYNIYVSINLKDLYYERTMVQLYHC